MNTRQNVSGQTFKGGQNEGLFKTLNILLCYASVMSKVNKTFYSTKVCGIVEKNEIYFTFFKLLFFK